ncbi:MAG: competence/damage-inducible protein A [Flavobacteriales bacterium]|nr:competence/damage-inducible protein A [Flavobacteriales bacterium]
MKAEIITIGDEILIGQTVDTNSTWLAENLHPLGVRVNRIVSITDTRNAIREAVEDSFSRADIVLMTGGLGPTQDDITKETLAEFFDTELERDQEVLKGIEEFFRSKGRPVLEVNRAQADLPKGARILKNRKGTAQGMWFERDGKVLISMPGVPYEMKCIMDEGGFEMLRERFNAPRIIHRTVLTLGIGESFLADLMSDWETSLRNEGLSLAYLPSPGLVRLRLSGFAENGAAQKVEERIAHYIEELERRVPQHAFGYEKQTIAEVVGALLTERGATLSLAESCTGGYISHLVTSVAGCSVFYKGGVTAYANEAKTAMINVPAALIETHGAVSEEVVRAMAEGARKRFGTTYAIATSGVAGPDGGTADKPVGTVWMALAGPENTLTERHQLGRSRVGNITVSALLALNWLRIQILSKQFEISE